MATLVRMNGLNIHHSLYCLVLKQNSISTHHIAGDGGDFATVSGAGGLGHCDAPYGHCSLVVKSRDLHNKKKALLNEGHTLNQLSLYELF